MLRTTASTLLLLAIQLAASGAAAQVAPTPTALEATVEAGQTASQTLTLQNNGDEAVTFSLSVRPAPPVRRPARLDRPTAAASQRYSTRLQPVGRSLTRSPQRVGIRQGGSGRLFGIDFSTDEIVEVDPVTGAVINAFAAPTTVSGGPEGLAFDGEALYYVASFDDDAIFKLDAETGEVLGTSAPAEAASFDALAHSGEALYGLNYGENRIYEIDFDAQVAVGSIEVPGAIGGMSFGGARGTLFVTVNASEVAEVDPADGTILNTFPVPDFGVAYGLGYSNALELLFVSDNSGGVIRALDPDTGTEVYGFNAATITSVAADEAAGVSWLAVDPEAGTIPASGSTPVEVTFDGTALFAGTYEAVIDVVVEDAVAASVPVTLTVTGEPALAVDPDALDFGLVFVDAEAEASVTVSNTGTAPLNVGEIAVSDPAFGVGANMLTLEPLDSATLAVTFSPTTVGEVTADLTLMSDDPNTPVVTVALMGEGVPPPVVNVEPEAIAAEAESGEVVTQSLTLSNTGGSPLTFDIVAQASAPPSPATLAPPAGAIARSGRSGRQRAAGGSGAAPQLLDLKRHMRTRDHRSSHAQVLPRAGFLPTLATDPAGDGGTADLVAIRGLFTPDEVTVEFESVAPIDLNSSLPYLLLDVDQDPSTGEDVSTVIDAELGVEFGILVLEGAEGPEAFLFDFVDGGIVAFAPVVAEGSTLRTTFPGGLITGLGDGAHAVGLTIDDDSGMVVDAVPDAGFFTVGESPPWLSVAPGEGTVGAGATEVLTVTLDASDLFAGTYEAVLLLTTNDPVTPAVTVPVTFNVSGTPELDVASELDFGTVFAGFPATRTLTVENDGTDSLTVAIESSDVDLTTAPTEFVVPPASAEVVAVTVTPEETGAFAFTLTLATNDSDESTVEIAVTGAAEEAPVVAVDPGALSFEIEAGTTASAALTISNAGGSPLDFELSAQRANLRPASPGREAEARPWEGVRAPGARSHASSVPVRGELPLLYEDAEGDAGVPDLLALRGLVTSADLTLQLEVEGTLNANDFAGVVGLDVDENPSTGNPLPFGLPEQSVGIEFEISLFDIGVGEVVLFDELSNFVGAYPAMVEGSTLTFSIPLDDLADDGSLTLAGVIGDSGGPTDWFPETGAIGVGSVAFLAFSPEAGTVPAGESADVTVTVDTSDLPLGTYEAQLIVATNDPATPTVVVPVTVVVGVGEDGEGDAIPIDFALHAPYPNPLRAQAALAFDLPQPATVRLDVFDVQGRQVATLADGERAAGRHTVTIDAAGLPSGVYICRLNAGAFVATTKVVVLR